MIGCLRMPFFKRDNALDEMYMTEIRLYLLDDEKVEEKIPMFVSGDVAAFFTDKRMVFVRRPQNVRGFEKILEMEFLPYKSVQNFSFLKSNFERSYNIYIALSSETEFSFSLEDFDEATRILELIGKNSV